MNVHDSMSLNLVKLMYIIFSAAFQCYTCKDSTCSSQVPVTCDADSEFCMTSVDQKADGTRVVIKGY